jgi:dTMP kinase
MEKRGKLIAVEGIDGSGKRTQVQLLATALTERQHRIYSTGFPQYDSWFGRMIGQFLNGDLGTLENVDPRFTALLYAGDRFEAKRGIEAALNQGKIVVADRYVASNLAHQTARIAPAKRSEFLVWVEHLEYDIYQLPREALVVYLHVPAAHAQELVRKKSQRTYTAAKQDILEASLRHLEQAAQIYGELAKRANWVTIDCYDSRTQQMRSPDAIGAEVLAATLPVIAAHSTQGAG